jgi:hypothetical protein
LFIATYNRTGRWLDLGRLDSFYLLLLLGTVLTLRSIAGVRGALVAGVLTGAAYLTKQSAIVVAVPLAVAAAIDDVRRAAWFTGVAALLIAVSTIALDRATGGWFNYYCFTIPLQHPHVTGGWKTFWPNDMLRPIGGTLLLALAYVPLAVPFGQPLRNRWFYAVFAAGTIVSSWAVRTEVGAEVNNLFPAYASLSMVAGLAFADLERVAFQSPPRWTALAFAGELLLLAQFARLYYDPRRLIPTADDRAAGAALVERMGQVDGEVYFPHHGYLARLAGKREYAHTLAMDNLFLDDAGPVKRDLQHEMSAAIERRQFGAVIMEADRRYEDVITTTYPDCSRLFDRQDVFWPVAGAPIRPEWICSPRK